MTERKLTADKGIPSGVIFMMAALSALTVANLYYNQPLLEMIRSDLGITQVQANLITVITQAGYALGLLFVIPVADMVPSRKIMVSTMVVAGISALIIAFARNAATVWAASLTLGICSITPQLFLPVASRFSRPEHKSRRERAASLVYFELSAGRLSSAAKTEKAAVKIIRIKIPRNIMPV